MKNKLFVLLCLLPLVGAACHGDSEPLVEERCRAVLQLYFSEYPDNLYCQHDTNEMSESIYTYTDEDGIKIIIDENRHTLQLFDKNGKSLKIPKRK